MGKIKSWLDSESEAVTEDAFLEPFVRVALWTLAVIVVIATVTGLVESFDGLYNWFSTHGITGFWADFAPLMVDSFTVLGELALFAGIARRWHWTRRLLPWVSTLIGITASVAGNVGDKVGHDWTWMATAAIPPLAGAFGIVIGLGVLKQVGKDVVAKSKARREAVPESLMISKEGLSELALEDFRVRLDHLEAPKRRRLAPANPGQGELFEQPEEAPFRVEAAQVGPEVEPVRNEARTDTEVPLRGLDVLIPPRANTWEGIVQPSTGPMDVAEVTAEDHADNRPNRGIIRQTGPFPAVT